jgi:hypothetical protein
MYLDTAILTNEQEFAKGRRLTRQEERTWTRSHWIRGCGTRAASFGRTPLMLIDGEMVPAVSGKNTRLSTPSGRPASTKARTSSTAPAGVSSDAFRMIEQPLETLLRRGERIVQIRTGRVRHRAENGLIRLADHRLTVGLPPFTGDV